MQFRNPVLFGMIALFFCLFTLSAEAQRHAGEAALKCHYPWFFEKYASFPPDTLLHVAVLHRTGAAPAAELAPGERINVRTHSTFTAYLHPRTIRALCGKEDVINVTFSYGTSIRMEPAKDDAGYAPQPILTPARDAYAVTEAGMKDYLEAENPAYHDDPDSAPRFLRDIRGRGVLVGIVEGGLIDFRHPDFHNPDGTTRFVALWDQRDDRGSGGVFGRGHVWSPEEMNREIRGTTRRLPRLGDDNQHVTSSAGVACGNGQGAAGFIGIAPEASIISSRISTTDPVQLIEACWFIFDTADSLDMCCAISISEVMDSPVPDGSDVASIALSEMVEERDGRLIFSSAGNNGHLKFHAQYAGTDSGGERFIFLPSPGRTNYLRLKTPLRDIEKLQLGVSIQTSCEDASTAAHEWVRLADCFEHPGRTFRADSGDSSSVTYSVHPSLLTDSTVMFFLRMETVDLAGADLDAVTQVSFQGEGTVDMWSTYYWPLVRREWMEDCEPGNRYIYPDSLHSVHAVASGAKVIAVGGYYNQVAFPDHAGKMKSYAEFVGDETEHVAGEPFESTQVGFICPDVVKPEVLTPGMGVAAAVPLDLDSLERSKMFMLPGGRHAVYSGTSSASPLACGMAVLYMQLYGRVSHSAFLTAVKSACDRDGLPPFGDPRYGYGKLNLHRLLMTRPRE